MLQESEPDEKELAESAGGVCNEDDNKMPSSNSDKMQASSTVDWLSFRSSGGAELFAAIESKDKPRFLVKEGIGSKQCPTLTLLWQERYFVLKKDGTIYYYHNVSYSLSLILFLSYYFRFM